FLKTLFAVFFLVIDLLQDIFLKFAGAGGTMYYNGEPITSNPISKGGSTETGIIYYLFQSEVVKNLLFSIMILALFLIVIFTAMAIIKNIYASKPKSWKDIVANSFKGLANFVFVPVCCLLGVWAGNILLNAIAGATSSSGTTNMSRQLFVVSAYEANICRCDKAEGPDEARAIYAERLGKSKDDAEVVKIVPEGKDKEFYATLVDQAYSVGVKVGNETKMKDIYTHGQVSDGYALFKVNYIMLTAGGVFMMYILINLAYAMVKRMFILLMLFVISPAMAAMYPLDDGKAIGNWKGDFLKNTIMAYSAVAGMNLFFSLSPIINNIELYKERTGLVNGIVRIILLVIGLFCVKSFIDIPVSIVLGIVV
ncbi:MAG: hypothetical protein MJ152_04825, partial [Clostridia bacterium]|nr:hypothetical protein [Clostridia bacterium]